MAEENLPTVDSESLGKANIGVLVVEDDVDVAQIVDVTLRAIGVERITHAENGKLALNEIQQNQSDYDLIISDWEMPVMSGIEFLKEVRALDSSLPFLMLTARLKMDSIVSAKEADVTAYIVKPFSPEGLRQKLETLVAQLIEKK
ncbi:MAG: response regulator [Rhodospirillaceae bacterium]|jgi:two-component system, chemotaxis family, chemotaxis protein CheY|nr:response regulator [Rhodospirillaceae bacterium]MBT5665783.1 response regulator [Rhodospirillaceae bacterium]MBT5809659.1 response regulator [Rhodospirillaceae bacterium]